MNDDEEAGGQEAPKTVPYERFRETRAELRTLKAQIESLKALETQAAEIPTLRAELGRRDALLGLARAGIVDDDGAEVAMLLWGRQPEAERKPIGEWVASLRATPDAVPRPLQPYLAPPAAPASTPEAKRLTPPTPAGGSAKDAVVSKAQMEAAYAKARQTGDAADIAEARRLASLYQRS